MNYMVSAYVSVCANVVKLKCLHLYVRDDIIFIFVFFRPQLYILEHVCEHVFIDTLQFYRECIKEYLTCCISCIF